MKNNPSSSPRQTMGSSCSRHVHLTNRNYLFIVNCHSKFPVIKKMEDLSAYSLILACNIIFSQSGLPKKIMSDAGGNFISDKFKRYCKNLNAEQAVSSLYHLQSIWTGGSMHQIYKVAKQKCTVTQSDMHIALYTDQIIPHQGQGWQALKDSSSIAQQEISCHFSIDLQLVQIMMMNTKKH